MVSALDFQAGYRGFEYRSGRDSLQTISTPSSYPTCPGSWVEYKVDRAALDDRQRNQVCIGDP